MANTEKQQLENMVVAGKITAMSTKESADFQSAVHSRVAYITVDDPKDAKKLVDFGLCEYTSEDGAKFFIDKCSARLSMWIKGSKKPIMLDVSNETGDSYITGDGVTAKLNFIKGEKAHNKFIRLQAIQVDSSDQLEIVQQQDPFAEL